MGKAIAIHSYKGGVGKTVFASSLGAIYAKAGKNVCIMDFDFRAPSLQDTFKAKKFKYWVNDFLEGRREIEDALIDVTEVYGTKGKFLVGLANPSAEAVRDMITKDRSDEARALQRMISMKTKLFKEGIDYLIMDTSPGIHYSSLNAILVSDYVIVVTTVDASDMGGTKRTIKEIYDTLDRKVEIVVNKVPAELLMSVEEGRKLNKYIEESFGLGKLGVIPCFCDVLKFDRGAIFSLDKPDHPFTKALTEVAWKI